MDIRETGWEGADWMHLAEVWDGNKGRGISWLAL